MTTFYRVGTANMYDATLTNLNSRQSNLVDLQEKLTAGKRVVRPSDDPVAAAQAERSLTRISRIQTEQRALEVQRNAISQAESTLGDAVGIMQDIRQLMVAAGSGTIKAEDRVTYVKQINSLREQLTDVANRKDTNGIPLLGALGSALAPFLGPQSGSPDYSFAGQPGQNASTGTALTNTLDGQAAFMFDVKRDGVYNATISSVPNGRTFTTDAVQVTNPGQLTGNDYQINFTSVGPGATADTTSATYTITNLTTGAVSAPVTVPDYPSGKSTTIAVSGIPGMSININGTPATGDTVTLKPSASIFSSIDSAVRDIGGASNNNGSTQAVGQALAAIDKGLEQLHNVRGYAGELLNRADRITGDQQNRSNQLEADRSRAEDLDMVQGISDFQNAQVGYEAALKSYAQVQKLSLFNFIN